MVSILVDELHFRGTFAFDNSFRIEIWLCILGEHFGPKLVSLSLVASTFLFVNLLISSNPGVDLECGLVNCETLIFVSIIEIFIQLSSHSFLSLARTGIFSFKFFVLSFYSDYVL